MPGYSLKQRIRSLAVVSNMCSRLLDFSLKENSEEDEDADSEHDRLRKKEREKKLTLRKYDSIEKAGKHKELQQI